MTLEMKLKEVAEESFEQGKIEGMIKNIKSLKDFGIEDNKIIIKIKEDYGVTEEEIKKYL